MALVPQEGTQMTTAHELVERGAALLDEKLPGWADQIDLESLRMQTACKCVLGQLGENQVNLDLLAWHGEKDAEGYFTVCHALGLDPYWDEEPEMQAATFGFQKPSYFEGQLYYEDLQDAWKGAIVARRTLGDVS